MKGEIHGRRRKKRGKKEGKVKGILVISRVLDFIKGKTGTSCLKS